MILDCEVFELFQARSNVLKKLGKRLKLRNFLENIFMLK